jgi:hypothetical protein
VPFRNILPKLIVSFRNRTSKTIKRFSFYFSSPPGETTTPATFLSQNRGILGNWVLKAEIFLFPFSLPSSNVTAAKHCLLVNPT